VETYKYAHYLKESLQLNLKICQSDLSPAHMEALYGKLWESPNPSDRRLYGVLRKVVPMKDMLTRLNAKCMLAGLRKSQTDHRQSLRSFEIGKEAGGQDECAKLYPLLNWTKEDVAQYFVEYKLPQHPLYYKGYTTVGDAHSSRPKAASDKSDRDTRFGSSGQQECGLHTESGTVTEYKSIAAKSVKLSLDDILSSVNAPLTLPQAMEVVLSAAAPATTVKYVVIGRVNCRFCRAAKLLLESMGERYEEVLVTKPGEEAPAVSARYVELAGMVEVVAMSRLMMGQGRDTAPYEVKTVPQIFYKGAHVGGYTELCVLVGESAEGQSHFLSTAESQLKDLQKAHAKRSEARSEASSAVSVSASASSSDGSNDDRN
jgi:phosphoadenylyl-sulfate reductase (thioredoxin)